MTESDEDFLTLKIEESWLSNLVVFFDPFEGGGLSRD